MAWMQKLPSTTSAQIRAQGLHNKPVDSTLGKEQLGHTPLPGECAPTYDIPSGSAPLPRCFGEKKEDNAKRARSILPDRHRADGRARAVVWASCCVGRYHTGVHGPDCLSLRVVAVTGVGTGSRQWIHFLCQDAHSLLSDGAGEYLQLVL